jgi:hypothetical protein
VSNPLTYGPIWVLAYRTGAALLGEAPDAAQEAAVQSEAEAVAQADPRAWNERLGAIGKPLMLGLAIFAVVGGVATWIAVNLLWLLLARLRRPRANPPDPPS